VLSYLMKAPLVPPHTPVVNALGAQRQCIINIFRACVGLPPDNYMLLEHKLPSHVAKIGELKRKFVSLSNVDRERGRVVV